PRVRIKRCGAGYHPGQDADFPTNRFHLRRLTTSKYRGPRLRGSRMMQEEETLRRLQRERAARVKRVLRWMPRRATIHRYPILKWFAASARQRPYLWTFRTH